MTIPPTRKRLRRAVAAAAAAATATALGACGGPDLSQYRAAAVPEEAPALDEGMLPPEPAEGAPVVERLEWKILRATAEYARELPLGTTAECPEIGDSQDRVEVTCTVTYRGLEVPWNAEVSNGGSVTTYSAEAAEGRAVARDVVEDCARHRSGAEHVRCDMDEVELIGPDYEDGDILCGWASEDGQGSLKFVPSSAPGMRDDFWLAPVD